LRLRIVWTDRRHEHVERTLDSAEPLFRLPGFRIGAPYSSWYDVDRTGDRFLVRIPLQGPRSLSLNVLIHWRSRTPMHQ
jgi:hypothetical protein